MDTWFKNFELSGKHVQLIPLELAHSEELINAASDGLLWNLWYTSVPSPDKMEAYIEEALRQKSMNRAYPMVVVEKSSDEIIGCTRFCNAEQSHRRLEIGYTWYAEQFQRTIVNTECKFLLLQYAFEYLDCIAVEFRTHWHNRDSRRAIERLGAKQDGVLRNHRIDRDGCLRDTVVYSIIDQEWPTVKKSLLHKLRSYTIV
ncbi:GNAT family N-acetyltransferase [Membranihabitans marinus]|uniref:GNAT family N-acetyltransferase n=1 Tax=Membranihabitans marinus TaxID=1227546 RepID=UPI001F1F163C|nr:GNAT family protein [Membranihabitans marinus]